jgi:hypothetical protein
MEQMNIGGREIPVRYGRAPTIEILIWVVALAAIAGALYYWWPVPEKPLPSLTFPLDLRSTPRNQPAPKVHSPVDAQRDPLPLLESSDPALQDALAGLLGPQWLGELFHRSDLARRFVVTVDNLPRPKLPSHALLIKPPAGYFLTTGGSDARSVDPRNAERYAIYARFAEAVDAKKAVAAYLYFYPLFEQEYRALGYPTGSFNARLIEAIDDLLMAPDTEEPVRLVQPRVLYEFADPDLEALSGGQKILLRMGAENEAEIKTKLREIRHELEANSDTLEPPEPASASTD